MPQDAAVTLGVLIRNLRQRADLTQVELAQGAGVSESLISNVESGKRLLGADNLDAVADALGASHGERAELVAARLRQKRAMEPTIGDLDAKLDRILELLEPKPPRRRHGGSGDGTPSSMPRPALKARARRP